MKPILVLLLVALSACGLSEQPMGEEARALLDRKICPGQTSADSSAAGNVATCTISAMSGGFPTVVVSKGIGYPCKDCGSRRIIRADGRDEHGNTGTIGVCQNCGGPGELRYEAAPGQQMGPRIGRMGDLLERLRQAARGAKP